MVKPRFGNASFLQMDAYIQDFEIQWQSSGGRGEDWPSGATVKDRRVPDSRPNHAGRAGRTCANWRSGHGKARCAAVAGLMAPFSGHRDGRVGRHPEG